MPDAPSRPNLVFILPDRQRRDSLACYGNDWVQTPHLNALAEQSFVFDRAYVTQPVCAPARASLVTGLYPPAAGMPVNRLVMPPEVQSVAQMVSGDYVTAYYGKWHLGDEIVRQRGFDEWLSIADNWWPEYTDAASRSSFSDYWRFLKDASFEPDADHPGGRMFSAGMRARLPAEYQMASFLGGRAAEFIRGTAGRPFVLYVSSLEPHPPFTGPYDGLYDPATLPVDATFMEPPEGGSLFNRLRADFWQHAEHDGFDLSTEEGWRRLRANYFGNITLVDDMAGAILGALDETGIARDTIVVFTSEHGDMVGTHAMLEMRTPFEEATSVPLLMRVPWLLDGTQRVGGNFSQIDMLPTLLELLGQPVPAHLQGESRAAVLRGEASLEDNDVFIQHNGLGDRDLTSEANRHSWPPEKVRDLNYLNAVPWRSVVTADRWKLTLCAADQGELFDLNSDPSETTNLFDEPEHRDRIRAMAARIHLWQQQSGDTAPLPSV
ncbi:MAG: sulfatase-like hydrolase/transferase [Dehalococcoidia bacterium]